VRGAAPGQRQFLQDLIENIVKSFLKKIASSPAIIAY
jgi:hypothetical protein